MSMSSVTETSTSALGKQGEMGCTVKKGGVMNTKKLVLLALLASIVGPMAQAQIKHIEMRVEGMT
jgi:hypothetical protein